MNSRYVFKIYCTTGVYELIRQNFFKWKLSIFVKLTSESVKVNTNQLTARKNSFKWRSSVIYLEGYNI